MDVEEWIKACSECTKKKLGESIVSFALKDTNYGLKFVAETEKYIYSILAFKKPEIVTMGVGSLCDGDTRRFEHVVFIDYDWINEWIVREELAWLCNKYKLTNFYLFATSREFDKSAQTEIDRWYGSYHAICCTKRPFSEVVEILRDTHADANYKGMPNYSRYKMWILRFIDKKSKKPPLFLDIVPHEPVNMEQRVSYKHVKFLETWFKVPSLPYKNMDDSKEILVTPYTTAKE